MRIPRAGTLPTRAHYCKAGEDFGIGRSTSLRTFLLTAFLAALIAPANAQSRQMFGYAGVLGEWELSATVTEEHSWWSTAFFGALTMKHVGLCTKDGPEEKTGELHLQQSRLSSRVTASLSIAGEECTYNGSLADAYTGVMACPGRAPVPLILWVK
jgi:hypothetical protein